jgi:UrcA family protein
MDRLRFPFVIGGALLGTAIAAATPAMAQNSSQEITVSGEYGTAPDNVRSLSIPVSYADLDLSTEAGRGLLRHRIRLTARFLCNKLGDNAAGPVAPTCRDSAVTKAMTQVTPVEANFTPRPAGWTPDPVWTPPYPMDWPTKYP